MIQGQVALPSLTLYRRNCHSSEANILCYLSSTTQIKLIEFSKDCKVSETICIPIPLEPVKQICVQIINQNGQNKVYVGVAFITRFIVFLNKQPYFQSTLKLDTNIVSFQNGFVAVDKYQCKGQKGFIFLARNGQITIFNIQNKNRVIKSPINQSNTNLATLTVSYPNLYMGTEEGLIKGFKIQENNQNYSQISEYDTTSKLPILNLLITQSNQIIATTCEGEIYILSSDLTQSSVLSAHRCMITGALINGNTLYTVGQDLVLNKFELEGGRKLKLVKSQSFTKIISLLFTINGKTFISFYETPKLKPV